MTLTEPSMVRVSALVTADMLMTYLQGADVSTDTGPAEACRRMGIPLPLAVRVIGVARLGDRREALRANIEALLELARTDPALAWPRVDPPRLAPAPSAAAHVRSIAAERRAVSDAAADPHWIRRWRLAREGVLSGDERRHASFPAAVAALAEVILSGGSAVIVETRWPRGRPSRAAEVRVYPPPEPGPIGAHVPVQDSPNSEWRQEVYRLFTAPERPTGEECHRCSREAVRRPAVTVVTRHDPGSPGLWYKGRSDPPRPAGVECRREPSCASHARGGPWRAAACQTCNDPRNDWPRG